MECWAQHRTEGGRGGMGRELPESREEFDNKRVKQNTIPWVENSPGLALIIIIVIFLSALLQSQDIYEVGGCYHLLRPQSLT